METGNSDVSSALRALAGVAAAVDVTWSDDRLLHTVVDTVLDVLGDHCTVRLTGADGTLGAGASSHPDAVREVLEKTDPVEAVVSCAQPSGVWLDAHGLCQYATFPLAGSNRPVGRLVVTRASERPDFTGDDLAFGAAVAALLGLAVVNRRMLAHTTTVVDDLRAQAEVLDQISDALVTCDEHLRVLSWNAAAELIYGYPPSEAIGCELPTLLDSHYFTVDGVPMTFDEVLAVIDTIGRWDGELRERHADGTPLTVLTSISTVIGPGGRHSDLVLINRDITAQRREEHLATHDPLTGLPNRRRINDRLRESFARACRTGQSMAVLFIDLDGFKPVNDRYGHTAGDAVLTMTAERIVAAVRHTDTVGRLGGDDFLVILENVGTHENIRTVADRIVESVGAPMEIGDGVVSVHPSIGIAPAYRPDAGGRGPDELLAAADRAMYLAKERGGTPVFAE